jgi:hypothetical protein
LQWCHKGLLVESVLSKLGFVFHSHWGPSDGQLSRLSEWPDPSLLVIHSFSSFLRVPRTPLVCDIRMFTFEYPPTWVCFHVCVGWTTLAGDDIGLPLTLLSHRYANAICFDAESNWSKFLI